ncbi:MAG: M20/M25/M40 family metallo-hydrolase [Rhodothermales bacterium]
MIHNEKFLICCLLLLFLAVIGCANEEKQSLPEEDVPVVSDFYDVDDQFEQEVGEIRANAKVVQAFKVIEALEPQTRSDHILITETPAPPFKEELRAVLFAGMLKEAGADSVWIDDVGNVIGLRSGYAGRSFSEPARTVALSAHLDTVFPEDTNVRVAVRGDTLFAPGIGDDSRGLVEVLTVLRALEQAQVETEADVLFIGTVGEEGLGDLRGVKHLFGAGDVGIDAWIAIDGGRFGNIVHRGLGSHRYRITYRGPGGHSWGAFGLANPHHALGDAISRFVQKADVFTQTGPKTSYNIGRIGGGTSINSIPFVSWMEVDLRSENPEFLDQIDVLLHEAVQEALDEQNIMRRSGPLLSVDVSMIGDRPSGSLDKDNAIVQYAVAATQLLGGTPTFSISSTDSNIPISKGIPGITIGRGGRGGNAHSLLEWWINDDGYRNIQWSMLTLLSEAKLADIDA